MNMVEGMALMDYVGAYFNFFMDIVKKLIDAVKKLFNKDEAPAAEETPSA